ncbi:MAG: 2-dehydropantoate 2-reductase N-terminal domain-containing protein, partial [Propionibacteriaceae bacterium]|nr:2-dehydropantoate 2-reductase N-terminal domain-containing protein [Propionibacteriaceae bacterium]
MDPTTKSISILGAGVIGQAVGARLRELGVPVWMIARGATMGQLATEGIQVVRGNGVRRQIPVRVADAMHPWPDTDVLLVTLRRDHV